MRGQSTYDVPLTYLPSWESHKWESSFIATATGRSPGLVKFFPALACQFCLALPAAFTQPWAHLLTKPCIKLPPPPEDVKCENDPRRDCRRLPCLRGQIRRTLTRTTSNADSSAGHLKDILLITFTNANLLAYISCRVTEESKGAFSSDNVSDNPRPNRSPRQHNNPFFAATPFVPSAANHSEF